MPKGKILTGKKTPAKPAAKPARRPQLDKMGPNQGFNVTGKTKTGKNILVSESGIGKRNADYAYYSNPANKQQILKEERVRTTAGKNSIYANRNYDRKGGK
jgi:hypothetical protein